MLDSSLSKRNSISKEEDHCIDSEAATVTAPQVDIIIAIDTSMKKRKKKNFHHNLLLGLIALLLMVQLRNVPSYLNGHRDKINLHYQTTINSIEGQRGASTSKYEELISANIEEESRIVNPIADQSSINKLQDEIKRHEESLKAVKIEMDKLKIDESNFCPDCVIHIGTLRGMKTTCRDHVDYIVKSNGAEYDDAREALMKERHKCVKFQ